MRSINWDWVDEQFKESKTSQSIRTSVERLLKVIDTMNMKDNERKEILDKFKKLSLGQSIIETPPNERWIRCVPGHYTIGDTARVKNDAYEGPKSIHNGKRGTVIGVRGGQAVIRYDGETDPDLLYYHMPKDLEILR